MKKLIIFVFVLIGLCSCLGMQSSAPDEISTPEVPADQDAPDQPDIPEMPTITAPEWAASMYDRTVQTYDRSVSYIPEVTSSGVGRGSNNWECCGNFGRFKEGSRHCCHRMDCLFALTGGCCCGLCCLDARGRLIPVLLLNKCCSRHRDDTPLESISDDQYTACSHLVVDGCTCGTATAALATVLCGMLG